MSIDDNKDPADQIGPSLARLAANDDIQIEDARPRSPAETLEPERAPEPPVRRKRRKPHPVLVVMNGVMTLAVVAMLCLGALIYFAKVKFDEPGPLQNATVVAIPKGEGINAIADRLEREGIISDRRIFVASVLYFQAQQKLKAGEYEIRRGASMREVLDQLVRGKSILYKVTIPEGLTSEQAVERLNAEELLTGEIGEIPPEGSLMPDTYKFSRGMTRQEMIERMQAEQKKFVLNLWENRAPDLPFKTIDEAITLASIVEKETSRADERARIAGVFINRLRKKMRLQSDPTIIYGLVGGKGTLGRGITREELNRPTPYNTYTIDGLPPGPIANPGRAAIEAVLNPAKTKDLYFVADGTGGHAFAPTLAAHNRNVARWREIEREMREAEAEAKRKEEELARAQQEDEPSTPAAQSPDGPAPAAPALDLPGLSVGGTLDLPTLTLPQTSGPSAASAQEQAGQVQEAVPAAAVDPAIESLPDSSVPLPVRRPSDR